MSLSIYVLFKNAEYELTCTNIVSSSFFIKETIDELNNLQCIFLTSNVEVSADMIELLRDMLTFTFAELCLNKIVHSETDTDRQVTYEFTQAGIDYMNTNLSENLEIELLLLLDCLDLKPYLVAFMGYLTKNKGREYGSLLTDVRNLRYELPKLYTKKT